MMKVRQFAKFPENMGQHGRVHGQRAGEQQSLTSNQGPPASGVVDQEQTTELADDGDDAVDGLVLQSLTARNADLAEDVRSVVSIGCQLMPRMHAMRLTMRTYWIADTPVICTLAWIETASKSRRKELLCTNSSEYDLAS